MKYETRTTQTTIAPEGQPIFSEQATKIEIDDEAGGEFVTVSQDDVKISISPEEWPVIRAAINKMIKRCRG
jgi:hypothetical protein